MSKKIIEKKYTIEDFHKKAVHRLKIVRISRLSVQILFLFLANLSLGFLIPLPVVGLSYPWTSFPGAFDMIQIMIVLLIPPLLPLATVILFNTLFGRIFCGWVCPFGFVQDVIGYITNANRFILKKTHDRLKNLKYILLFLILLLLLGLANLSANNVLESFRTNYGRGVGIMPYTAFAPEATLFGMIPLLFSLGLLPNSLNAFFYSLNSAILFRYFILFIILILIARVSRFYCRYICPMGAINSIFSSKSILGIRRNVGSCDSCGLCNKICPMQIDVVGAKVGRIDSKECIMCMECVAACHTKALTITIKK